VGLIRALTAAPALHTCMTRPFHRIDIDSVATAEA
jgi:hypothetical protein